MQGNTPGPTDLSSSSTAADVLSPEQQIEGILERVRRDPALRAWMLSAPTGALAAFGITLDDADLVPLLDQIERMDQRPIPVTAHDVMTPNPVTIKPTESVHYAAQLLSDRHIGGLPVCGPDNTVVGILSEYDLIARSGSTVEDVMSRQIVSVRDSASIDQLRAVLVGQRLKRVPVLNAENQLVGIVSRADLVRELAYRWACKRCGHLVRARHKPEGCEKCGAVDSFEAAPPLPGIAACPTCGRPLD